MTDEFVNELLGQIENFHKVGEEKDRMIETLNRQAAALNEKSQALAHQNANLKRQNEELKTTVVIRTNDDEGEATV